MQNGSQVERQLYRQTTFISLLLSDSNTWGQEVNFLFDNNDCDADLIRAMHGKNTTHQKNWIFFLRKKDKQAYLIIPNTFLTPMKEGCKVSRTAQVPY